MSDFKKNAANDLYALGSLTARNMKLFLKDKASVFFSLLAPLIILMLYILFLGDVQISSLKAQIPENIEISDKLIRAFVDGWMIVGVLSVACITVSLSANTVMVQDKTKGILYDGLASPVKRWVITFSYFLFNFLTTVAIVSVVYLICLAYLGISGSWTLSVGRVFALFGVIIFSSMSSTLITVFITGLLKTESQLSGIIGIMSAVLGFFIGAYMPMSVMPKAAQYISDLIPGSHSAGLFRHFLMGAALDELAVNLPEVAVDGIAEAFDLKFDFFGTTIDEGIMCVYLAGSIIVFLVLNILFANRKHKKKSH